MNYIDVIKVINSGSPYINEEFKFFSENGKLFFYNIKAFPVPNDRVGILFEDITRKKLTEKTIKESEEKYRALFDKSPNGIYLVGTNNPHSGKIVSANSKIAQMLGYEISELIGSPVENIIPEITYQKRLEYTSKLMSNESVVFETNIYRSDGQTFQVEITTSTVSLGDEIFLLSIVRDITEIKNAEKKLKENIQFLSTLLETIPIPIAYKNTKQEFIGCNTYYEKFIGLKRNEIIGKTVLDIFPKEYASRFYESDNELLTRQKIQKFENKILNANKEEKNIIVNKATFTDSQEQIAGIIEVLFDITELKKAQQIISDSQQKLLNIFNSSSDGIIITDFEYNTIDVNETLLKMLDIDWKKTKKINLYQYIPSDYHPFFKDILKKFNKGITSVHNEIEIFNSNKKHIAVEIYCKLINLEGKPAILNMIRDITERKNIEKRLLETIINTEEKERERFAGNLHDEVGPLLSSLKMYVSLINENTDKEKITYILDQINTLIREAIQTVREISNDLSPHVLNNYGFIAAINSYISIKKDFIKIDFKHNIGTKRYTSNIETILYRIVKELINNTIKHADAKKINISIIEKNNSINLDYKDDGKGFEFKNDMELKPGSIGIINIISRIKTINGKYTLKTSKERGFNFTLSVPLV